MLEKIEGKRRRGQQRMRLSESITNSMDMNLSKLWEILKAGKPGLLQSIGPQTVEHNLATEQQKWPRKVGAAVPRLSCCDMSKLFSVERKRLCLVFQQWRVGCDVLSLLTQQAILWDHLCWKLFCVGQQFVFLRYPIHVITDIKNISGSYWKYLKLHSRWGWII